MPLPGANKFTMNRPSRQRRLTDPPMPRYGPATTTMRSPLRINTSARRSQTGASFGPARIVHHARDFFRAGSKYVLDSLEFVWCEVYAATLKIGNPAQWDFCENVESVLCKSHRSTPLLESIHLRLLKKFFTRTRRVLE